MQRTTGRGTTMFTGTTATTTGMNTTYDDHEMKEAGTSSGGNDADEEKGLDTPSQQPPTVAVAEVEDFGIVALPVV